MNSSKVYSKILEEVRKSKKMSISDLCENIISERTYFRYMKDDQFIKYETFAKLALRLGMEPYEAIQYATFIRKGDPGVTRFIYRVNSKQFFDIEEIYERLIPYHEVVEEYDVLLQAYLNKYRYQSNRISKEEYLARLNLSIHFFHNIPLSNIYSLAFHALFLEQSPHSEWIDIVTYTEFLVKYDHSMGILLYAVTLDLITQIVYANNLVDISLFQKIVDKQAVILQFFPQKYFMTRYGLCYVHSMYNQGKFDEVQKELYQTLISLSVMFSSTQLKEQIDKIEKLYDINAIEFMQDYSTKYLHSNQFLIR
ncbi:MAG: helix-turn-helix domain-containing protein [Candidatus Izemoplasmatales bacterium]